MQDLTEAVQKKVFSQSHLIPSLYGEVDFTSVPFRFAASVNDESCLPARQVERRIAMLKDLDRVDRYCAYTMLGDTVADAYAALTPEYGFRNLIGMLNGACENGIESVRTNSQNDDRFDRKTAKDGSPYFNLKASNGQVIGKSEMYSSTSAMENGIASVKKNAPDADVEDNS